MRTRLALSLLAVTVVVGAAGGCGDSGASKRKLHEAFARGVDAGRAEGEAGAAGKLSDERRAGYEEGLSDGEEEARATISDLEGELEDEQLGQEEPEWLGAGEEPEGEYGYQYEPSYGYGGHPTTEDFGEGSGYVVECVDGTLSDSGGIQGACSHHGGVR